MQSNPFPKISDRPHFRIIPNLESSPRLAKFAGTVAGKVCISALFALLLTLPRPLDPFLIVAILFAGIAPLPKSVRLIGLFLIVPFTHAYHHHLADWGLLPRRQVVSALGDLGVFSIPSAQLLARLIVLGLISLLSLLATKRIFPRSPILVFTAWLGLLFVNLMVPASTSWLPLFWHVTICLAGCVLAISYFLLGHLGNGPGNKLTGTAMGIQTLALGGGVPLATTVDRLSLSGSREEAICQLKALKLLFWSKLLDILRNIILQLVFGYSFAFSSLVSWLPSLGWPNYQRLGYENFNHLSVSALQLWAIVLVNGLLFILWVSYATGCSIALFRLAGIYVPRFVVRPYLARTYNEYFRRLLYFYSEALIYFFLIPAKSWLRRAGLGGPVSTYLAVFVSVSFGGLILHILTYADYFMLAGPVASTQLFLSQVPYFLTVAAMTCASAYGLLPRICGGPPPLFLAAPMNFIAHASALTLISVNPTESWRSHLVMIRNLLGLS